MHNIESILFCYDHVRDLHYAEEPDYNSMKAWVADELQQLMLHQKLQYGHYDWAPT